MPAKYYIGTSGYNYSDWKGRFYPRDWPKKRWFEYYSQCFDSLELNATFYRQFGESTYQKWRDQAPEGFHYVLKAPRVITHMKKLKDADESIERFWQSANLLEDKLGLVLLQLPPNLHCDPKRLDEALSAFDKPQQVAVEFRHDSWLVDETRAVLAKHGSAFVGVDDEHQRPTLWVTGSCGYIRLHGRAPKYHYDYSDSELKDIGDMAAEMTKQGAESVYIFFNNDVEAFGPKNAQTLQSLLTHA